MEYTKKSLRELGIQELKKIATSGHKQEKERKLYQKLFQSDEWKHAHVIGLTISNEIEVATKPIIEVAWKEKKTVLVPKTGPNRQMKFFQIDGTTKFEKTKFGVFEPISDRFFAPDNIDLLLVPGLVYHPLGYRIGFGGGYYDRYLANYNNQTCSLVFQEQLNDQWVPESFDKKIQQLFIDQ